MRRDLEHQHQRALVTWARHQSAAVPELRMLFAIPNGTHATPRAGSRAKSEGVRAGVPDLFLAAPVAPYHGLFLELKVAGGRPSSEQRLWLRALVDQGYCAVIAFGWEAAKDATLRYLRGGFVGSDVHVVRSA